MEICLVSTSHFIVFCPVEDNYLWDNYRAMITTAIPISSLKICKWNSLTHWLLTLVLYMSSKRQVTESTLFKRTCSAANKILLPALTFWCSFMLAMLNNSRIKLISFYRGGSGECEGAKGWVFQFLLLARMNSASYNCWWIVVLREFVNFQQAEGIKRDLLIFNGWYWETRMAHF